MNIIHLDDQLHDNSYILLPSSTIFESFHFLDAYAQRSYKKAYNLAHATKGQVTMKMLMMYADGNEHSWQEVSNTLFPRDPGKDIDCWRSLKDRNLIAFSSKGPYGRKFYRITELGKDILNVLDVNDAYLNVIRWFKVDEDETIKMLIQADLNGEDTWKCTSPEAFNNMLEALFNPESKMHKLGSCYKWMNNVMNVLKSNSEFYDKMVRPEVMSWLNSHTYYHGVNAFITKLEKIGKKKMKNAA
jgi:DNA-binding PadR family transcriptional regulator